MDIEQALQLANGLLVQQGLRPITDVETLILRGAWNQQTYEEIANSTSYSENYLRKDVGPRLWRDLAAVLGEPVSKTNFKAALERRWAQQQQVAPVAIFPKPVSHCIADWGGAMDVSVFFGRTQEQATLAQWLTTERCRFILLLGMGGIGKTALSIKVGQAVQSAFDFVIWRSLRNAPPILELCNDLLKFLTQKQDIEIPNTLDRVISELLRTLQQHRCLLILDNAEAILQAGDYQGHYRPGYEGYGQLLLQVGETSHQSCLIVTSRERPQNLATHFGQQLPIRYLSLSGLSQQDGQALLNSIGQFRGSDSAWQAIIHRYAGNPLALKIVASLVNEVFAGDLGQLLKFFGQDLYIFDDIRVLLEQQFQRLSGQEQQIITWLAIQREPINVMELQADLVHQIPPPQLLQTLAALQSRSLIEKVETRFTLQPVVMEYVTHCLIERMSSQICSWQSGPAPPAQSLLQQYSLIQVQARDYVRDTQIRLILQPVLDQLLTHYGNGAGVERHLQAILQAMQSHPLHSRGYAAGNIINLLRQLGIDFSGYNFSQLTIWQADFQGLALHHVDFSGADLSKSRFSQTFGWILALAFSPDGQYLIGGDDSGFIHLWDAATEQYTSVWSGHKTHIYSIDITSDSNFLVSSCFSGVVSLWDIRNQACLSRFQAHNSIVSCVTFSKDNFCFASCGEDGIINIWRCQDGQQINTLMIDQLPIRALKFTQNRRYLISGGVDQLIRVWDIVTGECLQTFIGHTAPIWALNISPDGQYIASASDDYTIKLWELKSGTCLQTCEGHTLRINSVIFSPDGQSVASASLDQTVRLWDVQSGQCLACFREHSNLVYSVSFSPDGKTLASSSMDRTIKLWDVSQKVCARTLSGYSNVIWSVTFAEQRYDWARQQGSVVASGGSDGQIRFWNMLDGQCLARMTHMQEIYSLDVDPDRTRLISSSGDKQSTVKIWDLNCRVCLETIPVHTKMAKAVCFSHDGLQFASGGDDKLIYLFRVGEHRAYQKLAGHRDVVWSLAFSGDDSLIASSSLDHTVRIWNPSTGKCLHQLTDYQSPVFSVKFHPHENILATGAIDALKIWSLNADQWELFMTFDQNYTLVIALSFTIDGKLLATGSFDQTIRIWDIAAKKCLNTFRTHYSVYSVSFSADGKFLVAGGDNGAIQIWDIETGKCTNSINVPDLYAGMNIHGVTGISPAQTSMLSALGAVAK